MNNHELDLMLKLPRIRRWQIVRTFHTQSVADHSFRVWVLATHLYDSLFPVPHNSFGRELVSKWAVMHDMDEVLTGDIPSTVKTLLEQISPGVMGKFQDRLLVDMPTVAEVRNGISNTMEEILVKIADNVEAILYLADDGMGDCDSIIQTRLDAIQGQYEKGKKNYSGVEWAIAANWIMDRIGAQYGKFR